MSSSVIVARTRMWRMMVAAARGGSFAGAMWQRLQFAWNRFSPSMRIEGSVLIVEFLAVAVELDADTLFVEIEGAAAATADVAGAADAELTTVCC